MVGSRTSIRGIYRKSPEAILPSVSGKNLSVLDSVMESLSSIRDMSTSTYHIMSEFVQMQKMSSIENLAKGLSHDLNSGLMVLQAVIFQLERKELDPEISRRVAHMRKVAENLEGLVKRLKIIGPEELPSDLALRDFSIETKLSMDAMASSINHNIRLHFSTPSTPLPVLLCQGDIWRLLTNLLNNAQDAMPDGGDLLVGVKRINVDSDYCLRHGNARVGTFAMLYVCDHGKGMAPELQDRIFDPMFTTKEIGKEKGEYGWGLSIVYALVHQRGGWIDVQSTLGEGTTFEVFLPVTSEERVQ